MHVNQPSTSSTAFAFGSKGKEEIREKTFVSKGTKREAKRQGAWKLVPPQFNLSPESSRILFRDAPPEFRRKGKGDGSSFIE